MALVKMPLPQVSKPWMLERVTLVGTSKRNAKMKRAKVLLPKVGKADVLNPRIAG